MVAKRWKKSWDGDEKMVADAHVSYFILGVNLIYTIIPLVVFYWVQNYVEKHSWLDMVGDIRMFLWEPMVWIGVILILVGAIKNQTWGLTVTNKRVAGMVGGKFIEFPISDVRLVSVEKPSGLANKWTVYITTCSGTYRFMQIENASQIKQGIESMMNTANTSVNVQVSAATQPANTEGKDCCPQCHSVIEEDGAQFCGVCGFKLEGKSE